VSARTVHAIGISAAVALAESAIALHTEMPTAQSTGNHFERQCYKANICHMKVLSHGRILTLYVEWETQGPIHDVGVVVPGAPDTRATTLHA